MPPKKWSRQDEEKKLKDRMIEIKNSNSHLATLSKERQHALQKEVPNTQRQEENDVLQSAEEWCKFYEDEATWLEHKAKLEAQQLIDTNEALPKLRDQYAALRVDLDALKLVKEDPEVENEEYEAIYELRKLMLEHPKMVQAFFDKSFIGELKETFETKWSNFDERTKELGKLVYAAVYESHDEVKQFLENDFIPRLGQAIQVLRTAHTEAVETSEYWESQCEEVTARLEQREEELKKAAREKDEMQSKLDALQQEVNGQYSLLARLDITKTSTISSRPDLETIIRRAVGLTQSTSDVEAASILDSTNTDLPEGTQLIADVSPNVFFMITATGKVDIFDKADIQRLEYDCSLRMRLIMDGKSLLICDTPKDVAKSRICERWMKRSGVALTFVVVVSM